MMKLNCRFLNIAVMLGTLLLAATPLRAQGVSGDVIKIGIMNDQTGPYADNCGPGSVAAARLAVSDFGGSLNGKKIELVVADDQNKPDVGVAIALRWLDNEGVDAIVGCSASSIALGVQAIKQAQEFGLSPKQLLVPLGLMINHAHGIGLRDLQNVRLTTPFYWDLTPETRAFSKRFGEAFNGQILNEAKSATYSAITHYLKA